MGNIFEMAEALATDRSQKPATRDRQGQGTPATFSARILIVTDKLVYSLIEQLKDVLEAPSIGEVVRQAVRAYAIELANNGRVVEDIGFPEESYTGQLKKLNIRIPLRTKARLEFLKEHTGTTYTSIIFAGLGILARSADTQESILSELEKGNVNCGKLQNTSSNVDDFNSDRDEKVRELVSDLVADDYQSYGNR